MPDELLELSRLRAHVPPADETAMARARAALVHTATSVQPTRRRRFPVRIATTVVAGAAAVAALVIVPTASDNVPAASAVTINDDGTVTVLLAELADIEAANRVLRAKGIHAELITISPTGSCAPGTELGDPLAMPDDLLVQEKVYDHAITFRPDRVPAGTTLIMFATTDLYTVVDEDPPENSETGRRMRVKPFVPSELHPEGAGTCITYP